MATIDPQFVTNPAVAPYVWEAMKNGLVVAAEYPLGNVPETSFLTIGFVLRLRGEVGHEVPTFVNTTADTIRFRAKSLREATCPMLELDVAPGDALIWGHRRVHTILVQGGKPMTNAPISYETLLFGRESAVGSVQIAQVWPTGETNSFTSYAQAMTTL